MNMRHVVNSIILVIGILYWVFGYALTGYSQAEFIDEIKLDPPNPIPGEELKIRITFYPVDNIPNELSIGLITWTDIDNDYKYEEHKHSPLRVKANDTNYEGNFGDEMYVPIYHVPQKDLPEKYTVLVKCGNDFLSESITITSGQTPYSLSNSPTLEWAKPWRIPTQVAEKLSTFSGIFRIMREHATQATEDKGISNLHVYDIEQAELTAITANTRKDTFYESPTWSPDNQKIAAVIDQNGNTYITLIGVTTQSVRKVTDGPKDTNPLWLPDGRHILFLRKERIYLADTEQPNIQPLAIDIPIAELLAVSFTQEGTLNILYKALKIVTYDDMIINTGKLAIYLLELDNQFNPQASGPHELRGNKIWLFSKMISPSGKQIAYADTVNTKSTLILERINNAEKTQLFDDEYNYYEPAWSPNGAKIVFVSDRL